MRTRNKILLGLGLGGLALGTLALLGAGIPGLDNGRRPKDQGKKRPGEGTDYGDKRPSADFDRKGNGLWIAADCESVVEAERFWPDPPEVVRQVPGKTFDPAVAKGRVCSIVDTRALPQQTIGCTALDVVDTLIIDQGISDPKDIADTIMRQQAPLCFDAPVSEWPDALFNFYNDLLDRLVDYVEEKNLYLEEEHGFPSG